MSIAPLYLQRGLLAAAAAVACLTFVLTIPAVQAVTIVSWGEADDIVSGTTNMEEGSPSNMLTFGSFASPSGVGYYPNSAGKTPDFYGAAYRVYADSEINGGTPEVTDPNWRIISADPNPDYIYASNNGSVTTLQNDYHYIFLWTQAEFLESAATADSITLTGMQVRTGDNGSGVATDTYFVIQLYGSDYYVSDTFGEGNLSFTDPTAVTWHAYDPTTDFADVSGSTIALTGTDFENLTAAGVYVSALSSGRYVQSRVYGFEFTGDLVPEPTTTVLMLGAITGLFLVKRRRNS